MSKKKGKDLMDRQSSEKSEGYSAVNTGMPAERFSDKAQVTALDDVSGSKASTVTGEVVPSADAIVASKAAAVKKKMAIKPSASIDVEQGKQVGGVSLGETAMVMSAAGDVAIPNQFGSAIPGDQSRIPFSRGGERGATRQAKKISPDNFVLNNMACEQIRPDVKESLDLREAPDALSGYNGRKQFDTARGKKNAGDAPSSLLFERSVDTKSHNFVVHTTGQVCDNIEETYNGYPDTTVAVDNNTITTTHDLHKGNFVLKGFTFDIENGHIANPHFDTEEYIVPVRADERAAQYANMNWQVDTNVNTKTMVKLQTELGRETTDKWSPLGYVIHDPYRFLQLFHDGEANTGAIMGAAYKAAAHSLAFMLNMCGKDGIKGVEYIKGCLNNDLYQFATSQLAEQGEIFNQESYRQGSAAAMIDLFDSTSKYTTKADFFNQPRSWKMHLQKVDNYINPLHCKKTFFSTLNQAMMFSTEDGTYNPVLPIHYTDSVKLMMPYDLNVFLKGWVNPHVTTLDGTTFPFHQDTGITTTCRYSYNDLRRITYDWAYADPLVAGLMRWMLIHEASIARTFGNGHVSIPCNFGMGGLNLFTLFLCSAAADILWMRNLIFRDYLFAGDQGVYIFEDLVGLNEANFTAASQYSYRSYNEPLGLGKLSDCQQIRLQWPELIQTTSAEHVRAGVAVNIHKAAFILPFYFSEEQIDATTPSGLDVLRGGCFSYPSIRQGLNHEFVDIIQSMDERSLRLVYDRMVTVPVATSWDDETNVCTGELCGDRFHYSALRYDAVSDGRVVVTPIDTGKADYEACSLREATMLATPRELGFLFPMPTYLAKPFVTGGTIKEPVRTNVTRNAYCLGGAPVCLRSYAARGQVSTGTSINRTSALTQDYVQVFAHPSASQSNIAMRTTAILPSFAAFFNAATDGNGQITLSLDNAVASVPCLYNLQSANLETNADGTGDRFLNRNTMFSIARVLWALLQRVPTVINPFDSAYEEQNLDGSTLPTDAITVFDPCEFAELFGLCGFLASDYNQDILDRLNKKDELGMYYYEDEFIKASPLFRA